LLSEGEVHQTKTWPSKGRGNKRKAGDTARKNEQCKLAWEEPSPPAQTKAAIVPGNGGTWVKKNDGKGIFGEREVVGAQSLGKKPYCCNGCVSNEKSPASVQAISHGDKKRGDSLSRKGGNKG